LQQKDAEKVALHDTVNDRIEGWRKGKEQNVRALLASLQIVLWPTADWTSVNLAELLEDRRVKITYMKAIARVHPDKLSPNASVEQQMLAESIFSTLNEAYDSFRDGR